jgi:WhiB family transcriptional regulator, redox-sensing transcriptional regulator
LADTHWYNKGACVDNPEFNDDPSLKETKVIARSKAICRSCPVRKECWAYAYSNHLDDGIWGGTLPSERKLMGAILSIPVRVSWGDLVDNLLP